MHHDPAVWENPEKFDPDRFLPENCNERHPFAYVPFGDGPRHCLGKDLAILEIKIVLIAILKKWKIFSALRPIEMKLVANFNLRPYNDKIEMLFVPIKNV